MQSDPHTPVSPRWLHALAVLTVLLTLPLLFLGAGVTSHGPGVALIDREGFRAPWVIVSRLLENSEFAFLLEYGHRSFGFLVGMCGIALAICCWFFDRRAWMGWLALGALTLICIQGLLGIFRVDYHALHGRTFAMIHGMFAQIVFATLVTLALFTSRRWGTMRTETSTALQRWSIVTMLLVFVQLLLGGMVRHQESIVGPRGHLFGAFIVVGALIWLLTLIRASETREQYATPRMSIKVLLVVQIMLGIESWLARFHVPQADLPQLVPMPMHAEWMRAAHYLGGTLLFAATVLVALVANRRPVAASETITVLPRQWEGVR